MVGVVVGVGIDGFVVGAKVVCGATATLAFGAAVVVGAAGFGLGVVVVVVVGRLGTVEDGTKGFTVVDVVAFFGAGAVVVVLGKVGAGVGGVSTAMARTGWVTGESVAASIESVRGWNVTPIASAATNANMARVASGRLRVGAKGCPFRGNPPGL